MANRLKELRLGRGWTQQHAAERVGVSLGQWVKLERGERRLTGQYLRSIAEAFEVQVFTLLEHRGTVPILGVGGPSLDSEIDLTADLGRAPMPNAGTPNTSAVQIKGDVLRGIASDGWILYFDDQRTPVSEATLGELSVVCLADGRVLVRTPRPGSQPGRYHLESPASSPIYDANVAWAAIVTAIIPGRIAQRMIAGEEIPTRKRGFRRDRRPSDE